MEAAGVLEGDLLGLLPQPIDLEHELGGELAQAAVVECRTTRGLGEPWFAQLDERLAAELPAPQRRPMMQVRSDHVDVAAGSEDADRDDGQVSFEGEQDDAGAGAPYAPPEVEAPFGKHDDRVPATQPFPGSHQRLFTVANDDGNLARSLQQAADHRKGERLRLDQKPESFTKDNGQHKGIRDVGMVGGQNFRSRRQSLQTFDMYPADEQGGGGAHDGG